MWRKKKREPQSTQQDLNRAVACKRLLAEDLIIEAFGTLIEDFTTELMNLPEGSEEVIRVHSAVKSLIHVQNRMEAHAQSVNTHRTNLENEQGASSVRPIGGAL